MRARRGDTADGCISVRWVGRLSCARVWADRTLRVRQVCGENCRQVKNHKIKTSCPVLGFSRRETFIFELRFV